MKESSIAAVGWTVLVPAAVALALVATGGLRAADAAAADQWANLKGEFVYVGPIPQPAVLGGAAAAAGVVDESLVVGKQGELANVAVYLRTPDVAVHPNYEDTADAKELLTAGNFRFQPHMLFLRTSQTLALVNAGPVPYNFKVNVLKNVGISPTLPVGKNQEHSFPTEENLPTEVNDGIHGWMKGYVLIRNSPYAAVSAKDGTFEIKKLPAGTELEFQLWQEKVGYVKDVQMQGAKADAKGRFKIKLKAGDNDLGAIKCPAKLFEKK